MSKGTKKTPEERVKEALQEIREMAGIPDEE
jgi:hypothetical protein